MIQPISKVDLINDFQNMGISAGMNIMIHASLSKIGWVIGGAPTVVDALIDLIGERGTIAMPAATPYCLHPSDWNDHKINENWIPKIAKHLPVFNKYTTPTTMGVIPETFRNWPGTLRSDHPISSVCARGKIAAEIIKEHRLELSESVHTPYEKMYESDFYILLLGVGFNRCTMLHFAESKSKNPRFTQSRYPVIRSNKKQWIKVVDMANDNSTHFPKIGKEILLTKKISQGRIGAANSMLFSANVIVNFSINYFNKLN